MHPAPRLFGRIGELDILGQLLANVRSGQSAVLVVRGEPGIGKTELLRYLIAEAGPEPAPHADLLLEGERIDPGIRAATLPYVPLLLAAWRGDQPTAS